MGEDPTPRTKQNRASTSFSKTSGGEAHRRHIQHPLSHTRTAVLPQCICSILRCDRRGCRCGVRANIVNWSRTYLSHCVFCFGFFLIGRLCSRVARFNLQCQHASLLRARAPLINEITSFSTFCCHCAGGQYFIFFLRRDAWRRGGL